MEKGGYQAELVCLSRGLNEPVVVPLKFNDNNGQPPLINLHERSDLISPIWMFFSGDTLFLGQPETPGIWAIPISEIESAVEKQKQILLARMPLKQDNQPQTNSPSTR